MSTAAVVQSGKYALATGADAVGRLNVLHGIYSPVGRQVLVEAGLREGMKVADFGCGTGAMSRTLASMVGPSGTVIGIDLNAPQLEQARKLCARDGLTNTEFIAADASQTGLPRTPSIWCTAVSCCSTFVCRSRI
jgi:ubiquinone/menaquinone biosynthesis C-methylase UbiE